MNKIMPSLRSLLAPLLFLAFTSVFPTVALAQTTLPYTTLTQDTIWTPAESPYLVDNIYVPHGMTLTILPGTVVKLRPNSRGFFIDGTLISGGAGAPVIITAQTDDTVGGDTNQDGALSTPHPGSWQSMVFTSGSTGILTNTTLRYGGQSIANGTGGFNELPMIANQGGTLTLKQVTLSDSQNDGIDQTGTGGHTIVTDSTFLRMERQGIFSGGSDLTLTVTNSTFDTMLRGIYVADGTTLTTGGNTFATLGTYEALRVDSSFNGTQFENHGGNHGAGGISLALTLTHDLTLPKDGLSYVVRHLDVPAARTLTILPGAVLKIPTDSNTFAVSGNLTIGTSTATEHTLITSLADDTVGGDTNGDASLTLPHSGDWRMLLFRPGGVGNFFHTHIRYGGAAPFNPFSGGPEWFPAIRNTGGTLSFDHTIFTHNGKFTLQQTGGSTTITHSEIADTEVYGIAVIAGTLSINESSIHGNGTYGLYNGTASTIDATNNYWGSPTGPTHPSNPGGTGDRVTDNVHFANWTSSDPTKGCVTSCYSNVLFLPGLEASRLYAKDNPDCSLINCENQLWEPNRNNDVRELFLDQNGKSTTAFDIYTRDAMDEINLLPIGQGNIYKSFIAKMDELKEKKFINDWEAIPYDWRLSLEDLLTNGYQYHDGTTSYTDTFGATSTPYIIQELKRLAANSKTGRVTIIAHSNGGLVTKALMLKLREMRKENLVDKIILVASPQVGTPQAIGALLNGFKQGIPDAWYLLPANGVVLSTENARTLAENMPSGYNLLPSEAYFSGTGSSVVTPVVQFKTGSRTSIFRNFYGDEINDFNTLQAFLRGLEGRTKPDPSNVTYPNILNGDLLSAAYVTHQSIDAWTPPASMQVYQIAGWGIDTVAGVTYKQGSYFHCLGLNPCISYEPVLTEDGDGTVVVPSALAMSTSAENTERMWLNVKTYNSGVTLDRDHKNILEVPELLNFISDIITRTNLPLSDYTYFSTSTPPINNEDKHLRYFLHSPLSLDLYDNLGNHTGISTTTSFIENTIPGAYYRTFGEVKYITAPASTTLHLVMNGQASGYFTLDVQEVMGDTITATTSFVDIPTSTTTKVTINFTDGTITNAGTLNVDEDGDGAIDFSLVPQVGAEVMLPPPDTTPPDAIFSFATSTQILTIFGIDASSSPANIFTTATSTTIVDTAGNMLRIPFLAHKEKDHRALLTFNTLVYNGSTTTIATTTLKYKWKTNKQGEYMMFATYIKAGGATLEAHYRPKKNMTIVMMKPTEFDDSDADADADADNRPARQKIPGMVVPSIETLKGTIRVNY